jgi:CRISPR-associated endonuclease/helicase Cas3
MDIPNQKLASASTQKKLLAFLVPLGIKNSHWEVNRHLKLGSVFGLYHVTDASNKQGYACAFNQDALLLDALKNRLDEFCRLHPQSSIF